ncbi:MAG: ATP-binding cassette domain-containing protein [Thermoleophilia bacterium]
MTTAAPRRLRARSAPPDVGPAVLAAGLTKTYRGGARGIVDLDLRVERGELFGVLGPNGAGKSTLIRVMLDLIRPTAGRVSLLGCDVRAFGLALRARVGYLPGDLRLDGRMTGADHVRLAARVRRMHGTGDAPALAARLGLDLERPLGALSRGNRQKVGLVMAFMHRPDLLVLDEPTSGLDPLVQQGFAELCRAVTERGGTVLLSSHVLSEVQRLADRVALIREGRLELVGSVDDLRARAAQRVEVAFASPPPPRAFDGLPGVRMLDRHGHVVRLAVTGTFDPLLKRLARYEVVRLDSREADLEDVFLERYVDAG